jgi:2'-phosphotransferase
VIRPLKVTLSEIKEIVSSNDKQRFSLLHISNHALSNSSTKSPEEIENDDDPANYLICANQGHSIRLKSAESMHTPITLEDPVSLPKVVVHGTNRRNWPLIVRSGGLKPMGRTHVHFATGLPKGFESLPIDDVEEVVEEEARAEVISGMRNSSTVLIYIDLKGALESGLKFWMSKNGVVLCDGGEDGIVPMSVFRTVEERGKGVLVKDGEVVESLSKR